MDSTAAQRKPFEPVTAKRKLRPIIGGENRNRAVSSAVSTASFDALYRLGQERGGESVAGMVGYVVDYLVRTGQFPALLDAAIAAGGKQ